MAFSDDDGNSRLQSQGSGQPAGVDHQTVGSGAYNTAATPPPPPHRAYNNAVYYCSQDIATAFCARSDDGGLTFGPGVPIYNLTQCSGIHGHVKVAPDGTHAAAYRDSGPLRQFPKKILHDPCDGIGATSGAHEGAECALAPRPC